MQIIWGCRNHARAGKALASAFEKRIDIAVLLMDVHGRASVVERHAHPLELEPDEVRHQHDETLAAQLLYMFFTFYAYYTAQPALAVSARKTTSATRGLRCTGRC